MDGAFASEAQRRAAAEDDDRHPAGLGVGHAGDAVGEPRPGGDAGDAGLARTPGPRLGHVHSGRLVPCAHDADAGLAAPVGDGAQVAAGQTEQCPHAGALQHLGDGDAAVMLRDRGVSARTLEQRLRRL